jgi:hypothetical protein
MHAMDADLAPSRTSVVRRRLSQPALAGQSLVQRLLAPPEGQQGCCGSIRP